MKKRKDNREYTKKEFKGLKRKLLSAFTMFLVATILMTSTSYAWFVLSVAPEVTGISTSIGANGSLEMALLTTETRADLSTIRTAVGESLAQRNPAANNTWGNLVDLSYSDYGLGNIVLMPSRLNVVEGADGYSVDTNLISVPSYGYDGRIVELNDETMSATYSNNDFSLVVGSQDYGVRAIGTTDALSVQASALALAKANIKTYTNNAKSTTNAILGSHGDTLFNIVLTHSMDTSSTYGETELDALKAMISSLNDVADYIDRALRQGIIAVAASEIAGKAEFTEVRDRINAASSLEAVLGDLEEVSEIPAEFANWASALSEMKNDINAANNAANALSGGTYTWDQFRDILNYVMNVDYVYINDTIFSQFDKNSASELLGGTVALTLAPGSGVFADIADFTGNYSSVMTFVGTNIEIKTVSAVNPAYLDALNAEVKDLEAASGESGDAEPVALNATYGYAIDLAFRCNAATSDLLLQTTAEHRIYDGTETGSAMGGGSYMEFSTNDNTFALDKMILLMDAVRVTFIDDKNAILGIAKLNTSNRSIVDGKVKASLYLYEYSLSEEDGSILMGERQKTENTITGLEQNVAKAITAIVWLDGDIVDNTMVSATESTSLNGVLNLQFASSANLVPASNGELLNITADKTALEEGLTGYEEKITLGQLDYTTASWENFVNAYDYAVAVNQNPNANDNQVYFAAYELAKADAALEKISKETLNEKIREMREIMGTTDKTTDVTNEDGEVIGTVNQVDYNKNLHDEGNEIFTQIYTDESWITLAKALHKAEITAGKDVITPENEDGLTDEEINAAITRLEKAYAGLERRVFYSPYEYNGRIYYEAICNANDADTYGKWYDSDFKRVVADITILNLDAYAEPADIFEIVQDEYVSKNIGSITPFVEILDHIYPELTDEVIKGAKWQVFDSEYLDRAEQREEEETEIPDITNIFEVIYENESAGVKLSLTGKEGETEISIVVLTESGIVCKLSKDITVYTKADGIDISGGNSALSEGDETEVGIISLTYGDVYDVPEEIKEIVWASENTNIATVSADGVITAKKEGTTRITVSVETVQGNTYTDYITITVTAP